MSADRHRAEPRRGIAGEISPEKLAHLVLRTSHFAEAQSWWTKVLGARIGYADDFLAFLTYDDEHHRVALINDPSAEPPGHSTGLDHVAFTYAGLGDLLHTYTRLSREEIRPYWCINHGPTTSLYYRDPDGNQVELQIDNFETEQDLIDFMKSGAFAANPIGVEFDPEELRAKFEAGVSASELVQRDRPQGAESP